MPLQWEVISLGLECLARQTRYSARGRLLEEARRRLCEADAELLRARMGVRGSRFPWLVAIPTGKTIQGVYRAPHAVPPFSVVASDGSNVPPDRHSPVRFYVLNIGRATFTYGSHPDARLESTTHLAFSEEELYFRPEVERIPISGSRLGIRMALAELMDLAEGARRASPPVLALLDGSLILWGLQNEEASLRTAFLDEYRSALDRFRRMGVPLASFISFPGGQDVANTLRVSLCQSHSVRCAECALPSAEQELCRFLGTVRDRELFAGILQQGERSDIFESTSAILDGYGQHRIQFFYLNTGDEIVRLEAPQWVMQEPETCNRVQSLVLDQCRRASGYPAYPPVLQEAHEQAVISMVERRTVEEMVAQALAAQGIVYLRSAKEHSKRQRGV